MRRRASRSWTSLGASVLLVAAPLAAPETSPAGNWTGEYTTTEGTGDLAVRIEEQAGVWSIQVRATSQYVENPQYQAATSVRVTSDSVAFVLHWGSEVRWSGTIRGDDASGGIHADHWSGTWSLKRQKAPEP